MKNSRLTSLNETSVNILLQAKKEEVERLLKNQNISPSTQTAPLNNNMYFGDYKIREGQRNVS